MQCSPSPAVLLPCRLGDLGLGLLLFGFLVGCQRVEVERAYTWSGQTMGTAYNVTVIVPSALEASQDSLEQIVDSELRRVNDQMSTYLKTSELSQFNSSPSTEWFSVSKETAEVVHYSLQVSEQTDGCFDVTVGPLVNAWGFGPEPRNQKALPPATIEDLLKRVGYTKLEVRLDPPALRKAIPDLYVDLSAVAKGHGVDRVVEVLQRAGISNCLVEIGGEVRGLGNRPGGGPWRIGVERPDATSFGDVQQVIILENKSLATSGDYRNFFVDKESSERFSHTIDPRTGKPVVHDLASVSVLAKNCMQADAWATAINVMGAEAGLFAANANHMDVLIVRRDQDKFRVQGTGLLLPRDKNSPQ